MIVSQKAYFLKDGIDAKELTKYGFETLNGGYSYVRDIEKPNNFLDHLVYYNDSRIIKRKSTHYVWSIKVEKFIKDLIDAGLVIKKKYYYVVAWNCRNWSENKRERIEHKLNVLQAKEDTKYIYKSLRGKK